jgi:HEAT repeat protein
VSRRSRKPNIEALLHREDLEGLVDATSYREPVQTSSEGMRDLGIPVRTGAILALGELGRDVGREAVESGLRDRADAVRCAAVRVLEAREESDVLIRALRWLPADVGNSRDLAMRAVLRLPGTDRAAALGDALICGEDEELLIEEDVLRIEALLDKGGAEAEDELIQVLVSALADERGIVADRAGELLLRLAPASTPAVVNELGTGPAAAEAAYVLGKIADPETRDALVGALGHNDPAVRAEGAAALGQLQDPAAAEPLMRAAQDPDYRVRNQANLALDRLGAVGVIVTLAAVLEPMIEKAVRSRATRESHPRQSNGGLPGVADTPSTGRRPFR